MLDPLAYYKYLWPGDVYSREQVEIIYSVHNNKETYVPAGNMLGKDFIAGRICAAGFSNGLGHGADVRTRIVCTSVKDEHLIVLWSEILDAIASAAVPLDAKDGGPFIIKHRHIEKMVPGKDGRMVKCNKSYLKAMVAGDDMEALAGHHEEATLAVMDEASGLDEWAYDKMQGWAKSFLIIGNTYSSGNFFEKNVKAGDLLMPDELW